MYSRLRKQYYCDYCKKSSGRADVIKKHEVHCTNNPNRICQMCTTAGLEQIPLPVINDYIKQAFAITHKSYDEELQWLRFITSGCPACMLAYIRQYQLYWTKFDFKKECSNFIQEYYYERAVYRLSMYKEVK